MANAARTERHGQAMVEFVLALPLLLLMLTGLFDLGRAAYTSSTIANAARMANRVAIVDQNPAAIAKAAVDEAVWVDLEPSDIAIRYFAPSGVEISNLADLKIGMTVRVDVDITYDPAMPVVGAIVGPISMKARSEMPIERLHVSVSP